MSWNEAEDFAIANGGHLVSITSQEEQSFIERALLSGENAGIAAWIGINDSATEGVFTWSSGESVVFTNWTPTEPNDQSGEDYGVINWHYSYDPIRYSAMFGQWNDYQTGRDATFFGMVELAAAPSSVPEPASCFVLPVFFALSTVLGRRRKLKTVTKFAGTGAIQGGQPFLSDSIMISR